MNRRAFIIVITIILIVLLASIIYIWQKSKIDKNRLQKELQQLETKITLLQNEINQSSTTKEQKNELVEEQPSTHSEIRRLRNALEYVLKETLRKTAQDPLEFYLEKLKDPDFISTYGDDYTWYIATEELGKMGKPAIPFLIKKLDTKDNFERKQALYALMLAAQHENVKSFTGGEYVKNDEFPSPEKDTSIIKAWRSWYEKYKNNW
jgi:septal ring factor EnvC (AmiA/AmiB activator)